MAKIQLTGCPAVYQSDTTKYVNTIIEYAHRRAFINRPSLQQFIEFAIRLANEALKRDFDERQGQ